MKRSKIIGLILTASILLSGCSSAATDTEMECVTEEAVASQAETEVSSSETEVSIPETEPSEIKPSETSKKESHYKYDPHPYIPLLLEDVPEDYWISFHNLSDALRAGEVTFECSSQEAYELATNPVVLGQLMPAACMKITGESNDGTTPYENGLGRIYYQMTPEDFVQREKDFEAMVEDILNEYLEDDDSEFEIALKLYDYMESNYVYNYDFNEYLDDGFTYYAMMNHTGQCIDLAGVYSFLLTQAGVEAISVGCNNIDMAHEWVYLVIDGKGYYSDPTWSLYEYGSLPLYYFLMTEERRVDSGCTVDDLTSPLLPEYWLERSVLRLSASDEDLCFPGGSFLDHIDEADRTVYYSIYDDETLELVY